MEPATPHEIDEALATLDGWSHEGDALVKEFTVANFRAAVALIVRIGFEAEAVNHHPELTNVYNRVGVRLTTHDAGNRVTGNDIELARRIEAVA